MADTVAPPAISLVTDTTQAVDYAEDTVWHAARQAFMTLIGDGLIVDASDIMHAVNAFCGQASNVAAQCECPDGDDDAIFAAQGVAVGQMGDMLKECSAKIADALRRPPPKPN